MYPQINFHFASRVFIVLLLMLQGLWSYSRHIIGGEMTYQCTSPGNYTISMVLFRDCANGGAQFDSQGANSQVGTVSVWRGSELFVSTINLQSPTVNSINVKYNPCHVLGSDTCVERGEYTFDLSLPVTTETYTVVYQRCCRTNQLANIVLPGESGFTSYVQINSVAQNFCSDSPVFDHVPTVNLCANQDLFFAHQATDQLAGTVLNYTLCPALSGGGLEGINGDQQAAQAPNGVAPNPDLPPPYNPVTYLSPTYSFTNPLVGNPPLAIHPTTGQITGYPIVTGNYVIAICVEQYFNDTLLSEIRRELQFNVVNCEPQSSVIIDSTFAIGSIINGVVITQDTTFTVVFENPANGCDSFVTYQVEAISAIDDHSGEPFILYPNPFDHEININAQKLNIERITIYNNQGQVVLNKKMLDHYTISTDHLNAGLYLIEIKNSDRQYISRMIKL